MCCTEPLTFSADVCSAAVLQGGKAKKAKRNLTWRDASLKKPETKQEKEEEEAARVSASLGNRLEYKM